MLSFFKFIPSILLYCVFIWSYSIYVINFIFNQIKHKETYITLSNILLFMTVWCLIATLFSKHKNVPIRFRLSHQLQKKIADSNDDNEINELLFTFVEVNKLPVLTRTRDCKIRYCLKCGHVKPDRCHHCSSCGICRLKMDHHCPWINKCVGFSNYKKFVNLLFFSCLYSAFHFSTGLPFLINEWGSKNLMKHLHFCISCIVMCFTCVIITSLLLFHLSIIFKNDTTIESLYPPIFCPEGLTFNLGCFKNLSTVFGYKCLLWCLPLDINDDDGTSFRLVEKRR